MFTDDSVTPRHLEALLKLLQGFPEGLTREVIGELLQPIGLPNVSDLQREPKRAQTKAALKAGQDLQLINLEKKVYRLSKSIKPGSNLKGSILGAFDARILCAVDVETYFAPFFSYLLSKNGCFVGGTADNKKWVEEYARDVEKGVKQSNPFNETKITGLMRWYPYVGLGWREPKDNKFHPLPYDRIKRALPAIFKQKKDLGQEEFIQKLGEECPELDTGEIFSKIAPSHADTGKLTRGVSQALCALHEDGILQMKGNNDSRGWNIGMANPIFDANLQAPRLDRVILMERAA